ncbi:MJ0936 family phosphodiesterase [Methanothermococcus okinawensis]|uniref:Phosphoesterase n=1 Tax=Methanothermococcus okinawensis (strain DSM 14208 / JCM 11175 / IH1) TaxID=647113 RepID=F8ALU5_METOI|nr:MJ0936 family phosphodiesterase [Methanothermococcus okinawensis]AEH07397.1 phosphodiesterase, MJ0936 family [Methanothermococcus okinawensis IH1]
MKIGIISDTHDYLPNIRKAVDIFNNKNVDIVVHCGDFVSLFVIKEFERLNARIVATYGNNDGERTKLKEWLKELNEENEIDDYLSFEADSLKFFVLHGTNNEILDAVIKSKNYDVVIYGHTHERLFKEIDNVLVINPGECCGYLSGIATIGILDTVSKKYEEFEL